MKKPRRMDPSLRLGFLFAALFCAGIAQALTPNSGNHSWVAGTGEPGRKDGAFMVAQFDHPCGILHDAIRETLWVADSGNGVLRSVDLAASNSTSTLALTQAGSVKPFPMQRPVNLEWIEAGRSLLCYDAGRPGVAVIDLKAQTGRWLETSPAADAASLFSGVSGFKAVGGKTLLLCYAQSPRLGIIDLATGRAEFRALTRTSAKGFEDVTHDGKWVYLISRTGDQSRVYKSEDPLPAFVPAQGSPALSFRMLAPRNLVQPWAFVRAGQGVKMACDAPTVMAYLNDDDRCTVWHMVDGQGRLIGPDNESQFLIGSAMKVSMLPGREVIGPNRLIRKPAYLCEDQREDKWYLSDTAANRIVGLRRTEPENPSQGAGFGGRKENFYPEIPAPGTRRIAIIGSSHFIGTHDNLIRARTFPKRLEWYLSLFSSMNNGPRYEVMLFSAAFGDRESHYSFLRRQMEAMLSYHVDEVLICWHPRDFPTIVRPYMYYPVDAGGLPSRGEDGEFAMREKTEADFSDGAYLPFARYIKKNAGRLSTTLASDGIKMSNSEWGDTNNYYRKDLQDPGYLDALRGFHRVVLGRIKKEYDAAFAKAGRSIAFTMLLTAELQSIGYQETPGDDLESVSLTPLRKMFAELCGEAGTRALDISDPIRVFAMDQPFIGTSDLHHMNQNGADLTAIVAAQTYLKPGLKER